MEDSTILGHVRLKTLAGSIIRKIRSYFLKRKILNKDAQIIFSNAFFKVKIVKDKSAKIIVNGKLTFGTSMNNTPVNINLSENATLQVDGDLTLGSGVEILVGRNGFLKIGGKDTEKVSIIGSGSKIYVLRKVVIGKDFLGAFNVFISDCDWHSIEYSGTPKNFQSDTIIGNHVWVGHESSILKGTIIGHSSVVGCRSVLSQKIYSENMFVVGIPARAVKSDCKWKYNLPSHC
jgi:acetyltransferase-like isoleucine patch superfamily enzyme